MNRYILFFTIQVIQKKKKVGTVFDRNVFVLALCAESGFKQGYIWDMSCGFAVKSGFRSYYLTGGQGSILNSKQVFCDC